MTRLQYWKGRELDPKEQRAIRNIEKYACHIVQVSAQDDSTTFCYSVGLVETMKCPEIIVMGLEPTLGSWIISEIRDRVRSGLELSAGLQLEGLLEGGYLCELREVRPQWYEWLFGWATWYYGSDVYPALQCVWPDKTHLFPWEHGFQTAWLYSQPMLDQEEASEARIDRMIDSLQRSDGECTCSSAGPHWSGDRDRHLGIVTQRQVASGERPVLLVAHYDDAWQMTDGSVDLGEPVIICLHHLLDRDPTIAEVSNLDLGWEAWRDAPGQAWQRQISRRPGDAELP